ncbi:hypothetical protein CURTO8I2_140040 [Curtobacterium sp. 8I-2]|nr:hypothetical protein CURTO8I2_140040 [Curtobacterium sp. 8I-2]
MASPGRDSAALGAAEHHLPGLVPVVGCLGSDRARLRRSRPVPRCRVQRHHLAALLPARREGHACP